MRLPEFDWPVLLQSIGLRDAEVARKLDVAASTVCRWRLGEMEPRARHASALLDLAEDVAERMERLRKRNQEGATSGTVKNPV